MSSQIAEVLIGSSTADGAPTELPEWVMLARTGVWLGHPTEREVVTRRRLRAARDYFQRHYSAHGTDLVVDYHHGSVLAARSGNAAPAAGWVREVELRSDGNELWGRVLWTASAARAITECELRYLSPALRFDVPDRVTGERVPMVIHSVALTNTPFMTELPGLNAWQTPGADSSTQAPKGGRTMSLLNAVAQAADEPLELVAALFGLKADAPDDRVAEALMANARAGRAALNAVCTKLGLPESAEEAEVLNAVDALHASVNRGAVEELVDAAVGEGRIPPAHRAFYLNEARRDLDAARRIIGELPVLTSSAAPAGTSGGRSLTEAERQVCTQLALSEEAFLNAC